MEAYLEKDRVMTVEGEDNSNPGTDSQHTGKKQCLEFNNDSEIGEDESIELVKQLREGLSQAKQEKEDQAKFLAQEMANQEIKLNQALR